MTYVTDAMRPTGLKWKVDTIEGGLAVDAGFAFVEMRGRGEEGRRGRAQATPPSEVRLRV